MVHLADLQTAFPQLVFTGIPGSFYSFTSTSRCPDPVQPCQRQDLLPLALLLSRPRAVLMFMTCV